jgi:dienelactone hydrolase
VSGPHGERAVVCVNGGSSREVPGDWSATLEWLVGRLAPQFPELAFLRVRYRIKSWRRLDLCLEDGAAAVDLAVDAGARECALLGFSMGGAVAIGIAAHPAVSTVIGLAPWIPDRLDVSTLDGKRVAVVHGRLDAWLPGIPGVSPRHTLRGLRRIRERGVDASHTLISGAVHGVAVYGPWGGLVPLPRARHWARLVGEELGRFTQDGRGGVPAGRATGA